MTAIGERVPVPCVGGLGRRTRSTAAVALAALALGLPQWAAAQEETPEESPETMPPEGMPPEAMTPETMPAETMPPEATATDEETRALEPVPPPGTGTGTGAGAHEAGGGRIEIGGALAAGGGVSDFTRDAAREFVDTGGSWELRGVFGTRSWLGLEAAYIGAAYGIQSPGDSATLVSNGAEVSGRLNLMRNGMDERRDGLQPYALAGVAWKNYQLSGDLGTADVGDEDNAFEVPIGAGMAYYFGNGIMLDGRFAYRFAFEDDLIEPADGDNAGLDNWNATARLGVEF